MRRAISVLILLNFFGLLVFAQTQLPEFYRSRGFALKKCFQHKAFLVCEKKQPCRLHLFGGANRLNFMTDMTDLKEILPNPFVGKFIFEMDFVNDRPLAKMKSYEKVELTGSEDSKADQIGLGSPIACP